MAAYVGLIVLPVTLYLNWKYPDWAWLYLVDSSNVPGLMILPVLAASAGALVGGWYLGARLLRADKARALLAGLAGGGLVFAILVSAAWGRLLRHGDTAEYPARTIPLGDDKFVTIALVTVTIGQLAVAGYVGWELWKDGKRALTR